MDWQFTSNQGWPETCVCQVQLNNLASLEPMFFKFYQPMTGLTNVFEGKCPNCESFSEKFFRV